MTTATQDIRDIQEILRRRFPNVTTDGDIGPVCRAAFLELDAMGDHESLAGNPIVPNDHHTGKASFFAGPQDIRGFKSCKRGGGTDVHCFAFGDNGVGFWGRDCTSETKPLAAVPREVWQQAGKTGGARLSVTYKGKTVEGELGDTMPKLANVKNGAIIDLNPAFAIEFGIDPEKMNSSMLDVSWAWL